MTKKKIPPIHPGDVLAKDFMEPLGLSHNKMGKLLGVSPTRINQLVNKKRAVTAETALRLARFFKMSADFWMGLQKDYDLEIGRDKFAARINKEVKPEKWRTKPSAHSRLKTA